MLSYVSQGQCSQQCVAKGMDCNISVRMRNASYRAFYLYASEPQVKSLGKGVHVISVTYSELHNSVLKENNFHKCK